jgi:hypothetical protein
MTQPAFVWEKLGLVYEPPGDGSWRHGFGQMPVVADLSDRRRVFFSVRAPRGADGLFKSNMYWIDVALDDPMRVLGQAQAPLLPFGRPGTFDEHGLMPSSINWSDDVLRMYYCGWMRLAGVPYSMAIGLAESRDGGETFAKYGEGPLFSRTPAEPFLEGGPCVRHDGESWHMMYTSGTGWIDGEAIYVIKHARSHDGIVWERDGKAVVAEVVDNECQARPTVIKIGDRWHMWFSYRYGLEFRGDAGRGYRIGYAWSDDLITWQRDDALAGLKPSATGWDSEIVCYPYVFETGADLFMYYNGNDFGRAGFGCAKLVR